MGEPTYIVIINDKVWKIKGSSQQFVINEAVSRHFLFWKGIWDEKMKATSEIKEEMLSDEEILSSEDIKTIRIYDIYE